MLHAQGSITIRRRPKDGNPGADAVRYWLVPSVSQVKKTDDGKYHPTTVTCEKRKQTGNSSPIVTTEGTLKYQIGYTDNSTSNLTNYSSAITIPANCQWIKFVLYVNNIDVATETVPVVADGESVFILDLDNEMQGIPCNSSGTPTIAGTLASTNSTVYKGASVDTGWTFSKQDSGCTSTINSSTGKVEVSAISADKASVTITATKGSQSLSAVMSLYKVKSGKDGDNGDSPVIYSIEASVSAISRNAAGTLSPTSITAYKNKTVGTTTTRTTEKTLKYKREGQDTSETTLSNTGGTINSINASCTAILLKIYDSDGSTLLDGERIPIVKDGKNGEDGEDGNDGEDAVHYWLVPSVSQVTKSASGVISPTTVSCNVMKQVGNAQAESVSDLFAIYRTVSTSNITSLWKQYTPNADITISATTKQVIFQLYKIGSVTNGIASGTGTMYDTVTIPVVIDGKTGSTGPQGLQGCIVRITEWSPGMEYHNDEALTSGTRYIDIVVVTSGVTSFTAYQCKQTHNSSDTLTPANETYWQKFNSMVPIYTPMIMAQYAILRIAQANQIQVMKDDGVTVNAALGGGNYPLWIGANQPQEAKFYVDDEGRAFMKDAEIAGRVLAGVANGQRVELQPDNKSMKIYDSSGIEVASYEGNSYNSLSSLFSNKTGSFTMNDNKKGSLSLYGDDIDHNKSNNATYKASSAIQSDTPIEVVMSGYLQTYNTDLPNIEASTTNPDGNGSNPNTPVQTEITKPQVQKPASASLSVYIYTYSDSALTNLIGRTYVAACGGRNNLTLSNKRVKTSAGGYHVIVVTVGLYAVGSGQSAWAKWGSAVSQKADISATYTSDFYVSRYFANGFCLGQSTTNYIWAYNQGTGGMRFVMENNGYGLDVSNAGIKYKHHSGNWMNMPMLVFRGRAYNYAPNNVVTYIWTASQSFNNNSPTLSRINEGQIKVIFPNSWISAGITPSNCMINVFGYGTVNGSSDNPVKAQIYDIGSNYVTVSLSDDASENDGSFFISIFTV